MFFIHLQTAFNSYIEAFALIKKHRLWKMFWISGLLYLVIIAIGAYSIWAGMHVVSNYILNLKWVKRIDDFKLLHWLFTILIWGIDVASFFVFFSLYKYVLLVLGSPLYSYISEKTASAISGQQFSFNSAQFVKDMIRGIRLSIRNLVKQSIYALLLLLLSLLPIIGLISAILFIVLDSYYYGFAMLDYHCERQKLNTKQSVLFVKQHKGLAIGNGIVFYALFFIPVIGIMFGAPLSAIAATISVHKK
jgi:CysZ protein